MSRLSPEIPIGIMLSVVSIIAMESSPMTKPVFAHAEVLDFGLEIASPDIRADLLKRKRRLNGVLRRSGATGRK